MMPTLNKVIAPLVKQVYEQNKIPKPVIFGDLFSGTGFISNHMKNNEYISGIVSCDLELYSYVLNYALLKCVCTERIIKLITFLNGKSLPLQKGLIWKNFSPAGGRLFYTEDNAIRIDSIRIALAKLYKENKINFKELMFLLASLLTSCSKYANTASCFRAYLKKFYPRSMRPFVLHPVHKNSSQFKKLYKIYQDDAIKISKKEIIDIAYLDPPYNANHYGSYYSFYNYLLCYSQNFKISGVAGVASSYNKSSFGLKSSAKFSLKEIANNLRASKFIVMSYNSEGILSKEDIFECFKSNGTVCLYKTINKKFRPHDNVKGRHVVEYIFVINNTVACANSSLQEEWLNLRS